MFLGIIAGLSIFLIILIFLSIKAAALDKNSQKELGKMLAEVTAQVKEKNDALKEEIEKFKGMEDELNSLKAKLEAQNKKMEAKNTEEAEAKKAIEKLRADIAAKDKQLSDNLSLLDRQVNEIRSLNDILRKKDKDISSLNEAYNGLKEQYDDLGRHLSEINQEKSASSKPVAVQPEPKSIVKTDKATQDNKSTLDT